MSHCRVISYETKINLFLYINNAFIVPCEKSDIVSLTSSRMKNIVAFRIQSRLPVKSICCIAFGSASTPCYSLKSVAINLKFSLNNLVKNWLYNHLLHG